MNTNMISCFLESARSGSFSKAAASLFFTQQTVSRQVSLLEAELGIQLFVRSGAGVVLTKEGEYYFTLFKHSRQDQKLLQQKIEKNKKEAEQKICLGCSEWILPYEELIPAIQDFQAGYEKLHISFCIYTNKELRQRLEDGSIDLGFFSEGHLPDRIGFRYVPVCEEEICVVGADDVVGFALSKKQREERRNRPFLIVPAWERGYLENKEFSWQELRQLDILPEQVHLVSNLDSMLAMMQQKKYLAFSDARFGPLAGMEGMGCEKLGIRSYLYGCSPYQSENKYAPLLLEYLKEKLKGLSH